MKALCIGGSPAPHSLTAVAVQQAAVELSHRGFEVSTIELVNAGLPHTDPEFYWGAGPHRDQAVRYFIGAVLEADAIVLGTPVHHASFSGLLKSALDLLQADAFDTKAIGLVANAGGTRGSTIACEHLRTVVKALGGWPVPTQLVTSAGDFDAERTTLTGVAPLRRCAELADQMLAFTKGMRPLAAG